MEKLHATCSTVLQAPVPPQKHANFHSFGLDYALRFRGFPILFYQIEGRNGLSCLAVALVFANQHWLSESIKAIGEHQGSSVLQ